MERMKKILKKISILTVCACLAGMVFVQTAFAAGGPYVSNTSIDVVEGETVYIAVGADNAAGSYSIYSSGNASANGGGWLDNDTATIGIYGAAVGGGTVTIYFDSFATYDGDDLDGQSIEVYVNVIPADGGAVPPEKGGEEQTPQEEQTTEPETTTAAPAPVNKLQTSYNGASYLIQNDLTGIELPAGFQVAEGRYNGEKVKVLRFNDELTLYALRSEADGSILFLTYDEKAKQFLPPRTIVQNQSTYYLLDVPDTVQLPEGYLKKVIRINNFDVNAIVPKDSSKQDFAYVRAMVNGEAGYYSYDMKQGTFQRAPEFEALLKGSTKDTKKEGMSKTMLIAIIAGGVVILGLIVAIILVASRKRRRRHHDDDDHYPDSFFTDGLDEEDDFDRDFDRDRVMELERDFFEDDLSDDMGENVKFDDTRKYSRMEKARANGLDMDAYEMEIENLIDEDFD